MTDPEFDHVQTIAPFQNLLMSVHACPIDPRLTFSEANTLLLDIHPHPIVTSAPRSHAAGGSITDSIVPIDTPVVSIDHMEAISIGSKRHFQSAMLNQEVIVIESLLTVVQLALRLQPEKIGDSAITEVSALLD